MRAIMDAHLHAFFGGVVGAARFEPATWSTQNSRATRLRYTPEHAAALRYTVRFSAARSSRSAFEMVEPTSAPSCPDLSGIHVCCAANKTWVAGTSPGT